MSLALYRKYRPASFAEIIGQDHVTGPLVQALTSGRIQHAYLFSGPRGCGKTSSARILARSLNCEQGPTPDPCGQCDSCVGLAPGGPGTLDVVEIDAASHGGVDDARDLRERAFFAPVASRFKVYVIDEAHMVTTQGFNALLKLVEEPPEHVKFVFATTEPDKVIATIRSRTHSYPFRLVPPAVLRDHLARICAAEGAEVEEAVLPLVVRAGAGSVRDALSILDQLLSGAADRLTYAQAVGLLGYVDDALLDEVVEAFAAQDGAAVFQAVNRVVDGGLDPRRFAADLLERYRDLIVLKVFRSGDPGAMLAVPDDQLQRMRAQAARIPSMELSRAADLLSAGLTEMRGATSPRLQLELVCARILIPAAEDDASALRLRLHRLERRLELAGEPVPGGGRAEGSRTHPTSTPRTTEPDADPLRNDARDEPVDDSRPARATRRGRGEPAATAGRGKTASTGRGEPAATPGHRGPVATADQPEASHPGTGEPPGGGIGHAAGERVHSDVADEEAADRLPEQAGGWDVATVRRAWPEVLEAVKAIRKTPYALLLNATVLEVAGDRLVIGFATSGLARQFGDPYAAVLAQGLRAVLGVDWAVVATVGRSTGEGPAEDSARRVPSVTPDKRGAATGRTSPNTGTVVAGRTGGPGQRPGPEETAGSAAAGTGNDAHAGSHPDADPDTDPTVDAGLEAVALIQRGLGARIIDDVDEG